MKGQKCPECEHFTLFLMSPYLQCSECGVILCKIWLIDCPHDYNQSFCDECWKGRLNATSRGG